MNNGFKVYPETKDIVKDFTWYTNACSNYNMTYPGLAHELTGSFLPAPANNFFELFDKMWHSPAAESFYKQIKEAGYDARLYCSVGKWLIGVQDYYHRYFSNISAKEITYEIDYDRLHSCLKQMSGFSFAPFFFKKFFFYGSSFADNVVQKRVYDISSNSQGIPRENSAFLKKMIASGIKTTTDKPTLSIYYTEGAHGPFYLDENGNETKTPVNNPYPTIKRCFDILSEFIRLLKAANIYDNTAFLVCSDHGSGNGYKNRHAMAFMIKPFHENKKELSIDDTKVQSIDILPTLLFFACGDKASFKDFDGCRLSNISNDRIRKVYRLSKIKNNRFPTDKSFEQAYNSCNALEEYIYVDQTTFKYGTDSESFVRHIPLVELPK